MANSLIEDVLDDQQNNDNEVHDTGSPIGQKKSRGPIVALIVVIVLIVAIAIIISIALNNSGETISKKAKFFDTLTSNNISEVADVSLEEEFVERLFTESSSEDTEVSITSSYLDEDVSSIDLEISSMIDIENRLSFSNVSWVYSNNDLLDGDVLFTSDAIGFTSEDIVTPYVAYTYDYLYDAILDDKSDEENVFSSIDLTSIFGEDAFDFKSLDIVEIIESFTDLDKITITDESMELYKNVLNNDFEEEEFTSSNVTLDDVDATEYSLTLTETKALEVGIDLLNAFEDDDVLLSDLTKYLNVFGLSEDILNIGLEYINVLVNDLEGSEDELITISVYDSNDQTVQIAVDYRGYRVEVEYGYLDNENDIKLTIVDENSTGKTITIKNTKNDLKSNIDVNYSTIDEAEVSSTYEVNLTTIKSGSDYEIDLVVSYKDLYENNWDVSIVSAITFDDTVTVESPVYDEEFVVLNEMKSDVMKDLEDQITNQIDYVINDRLSQIPFLNTNTGSTSVEQIEAERNTQDENELQAMQALQDEIIRLQDEREDNSEALTIEDLENLELDGYDVSVEIGDEIAIVTVGDYVFNVDSEFQISK